MELRVLALVGVLGLVSIAQANDLALTKAKILQPLEEKLWIEAVNNHKTADGATVQQVLNYAAKLRPDIFQFASPEVSYDGETGEPDGAGIGYWIGLKRLPDDRYIDMYYDIARKAQHIEVSAPINPYIYGTIINALEDGRDSFLLYIDGMYRETCFDLETKAKLC